MTRPEIKRLIIWGFVAALGSALMTISVLFVSDRMTYEQTKVNLAQIKSNHDQNSEIIQQNKDILVVLGEIKKRLEK